LNLTGMVGSGGLAQIIHNHLGWTKYFGAVAVTPLDDFADNLIRLAGVVPHGHSFVPVGIKWPTDVLDNHDPVVLEQLAQLLECLCHSLLQLRGGTGLSGRQGAFEIVENGQQVGDEGVFLRRRLVLGIAPGAFSEVVEVSGKAQVIVLLGRELLLEDGWVSRRRHSCRGGKFGIAGWQHGAGGRRAFFLLCVHGAVTNKIF